MRHHRQVYEPEHGRRDSIRRRPCDRRETGPTLHDRAGRHASGADGRLKWSPLTDETMERSHVRPGLVKKTENTLRHDEPADCRHRVSGPVIKRQ